MSPWEEVGGQIRASHGRWIVQERPAALCATMLDSGLVTSSRSHNAAQPQCDSIKRWLGWGPYEWPQRAFLALPPCEVTTGTHSSVNQEKDYLASRAVREKCLLFRPPTVCSISVVTAGTDQDDQCIWSSPMRQESISQLGKLRPDKLKDLLKVTEQVSELGFEPRQADFRDFGLNRFAIGKAETKHEK